MDIITTNNLFSSFLFSITPYKIHTKLKITLRSFSSQVTLFDREDICQKNSQKISEISHLSTQPILVKRLPRKWVRLFLHM